MAVLLRGRVACRGACGDGGGCAGACLRGGGAAFDAARC